MCVEVAAHFIINFCAINISALSLYYIFILQLHTQSITLYRKG
jgi:hypothetical protein